MCTLCLMTLMLPCHNRRNICWRTPLASPLTRPATDGFHVVYELRHHGLPFFLMCDHVHQLVPALSCIRIQEFTLQREHSPRRSSATTDTKHAPRIELFHFRPPPNDGCSFRARAPDKHNIQRRASFDAPPPRATPTKSRICVEHVVRKSNEGGAGKEGEAERGGRQLPRGSKKKTANARASLHEIIVLQLCRVFAFVRYPCCHRQSPRIYEAEVLIFHDQICTFPFAAREASRSHRILSCALFSSRW